MKCSICVLAAGESKRFKGEKLLHVFNHKALSQHVLDLINKLNHDDSIIFYKTLITKPKLMSFFKCITSNDWLVIENKRYQEGMSTSIKLSAFEAIKTDSDSILLFLADMPKIKQKAVQRVLQSMQSHPERIIRPFYNTIPGFPVAIPKILFEELTELKGDIGAKPVIEKHKDRLIKLQCNDIGSIFDIDKDI